MQHNCDNPGPKTKQGTGHVSMIQEQSKQLMSRYRKNNGTSP